MLRAALLLSLLPACQAPAAELAVLSTGAMIPAERHELIAGQVRLYLNGGYIELPAQLVVRFDPDDRPAAPKLEQPQPSAAAKPVHKLIQEAAERWGLPPELVSSVARAESGYRSDAVSPKGALGLMQLMPDTARLLGADPNDPEQNVDAGARYLRELLLKYDSSLPKALAAYNAGPGAVDRYGDIPPYRETRDYIRRVVKQYQAAAPAR